MKKTIAMFAVVVFSAVVAGASEFSIESLKSGAFNMTVNLPEAEVNIPVAANPVKEEPAVVGQDLIYKFQNLKNEVWRMDSDTTWLRNDLNNLENDARRISQGTSNAFFSSDLRNMSYKMSTYSNDIQRMAVELQNLLSLAQKDKQLNSLASDIQWDITDIDNRFQFDVQNAAQSLESTVRRIDPKLVGYDAQWQASDISRYSRDLSWKTRDMRWDAQTLVQKTQP